MTDGSWIGFATPSGNFRGMGVLLSGQETTLVISKGFEIEKSRRYAKSEILVWFNLVENHDFITS